VAEAQQLSGPDLTTEGVSLVDLVSGIPRVGHAFGKPVVVVRSGDGVVRAVGGRCTHYGGPLGKGLCVGAEIRCPWHHAAFDLVTGEAVGAPALNPIPVYEVVERDGMAFVTGVREPDSTRPVPVESPQSVVIVGAGAAGAAAAEALRRYGFAGPVSLVGTEAPVDRPNLSKDYLAGTAPEELIPLRYGTFYDFSVLDMLEVV
jgi:nitrite reductase/ring-hydroxylating ferredoxin subunit